MRCLVFCGDFFGIISVAASAVFSKIARALQGVCVCVLFCGVCSGVLAKGAGYENVKIFLDGVHQSHGEQRLVGLEQLRALAQVDGFYLLRVKEGGEYVFEYVLSMTDVEMVEVMLRSGANPNQPFANGGFPLATVFSSIKDYSSVLAQRRSFEALIESGADVDKEYFNASLDNYCYTPIVYLMSFIRLFERAKYRVYDVHPSVLDEMYYMLEVMVGRSQKISGYFCEKKLIDWAKEFRSERMERFFINRNS